MADWKVKEVGGGGGVKIWALFKHAFVRGCLGEC